MPKIQNTSSNSTSGFANKIKTTTQYISYTIKQVQTLPYKVNQTIDKIIKFTVNYFLDTIEGSVDFCFVLTSFNPLALLSEEDDPYGIGNDSEISKSTKTSKQKKSNPLDHLKKIKQPNQKVLFTIKSVKNLRTGIQNNGDSCFFISVVQAIASSPSLMEFVKTHTLKKKPSEKTETFKKRQEIQESLIKILDHICTDSKPLPVSETKNLRKLFRGYYDTINADNAKLDAVVNVEDRFLWKLKEEIHKKKVAEARKKNIHLKTLHSSIDSIVPTVSELSTARKKVDFEKLKKNEEQQLLKKRATINDTGQHDATEFFQALMEILEFKHPRRIIEHLYTGGLEKDFDERNMPRQVYLMNQLDFATASLPQSSNTSKHVRSTKNSPLINLGTLFKFGKSTAESPCRTGQNQTGKNWFDEENYQKPSSQKIVPMDEESMHLFSPIQKGQIDETTIPKTIPILLKRFNNFGQKLSTPVECPETIEIDIMSGTPLDTNSDETDLIDPKPTGKKAIYEIKTVVIQVGGTQSGHYYSYSRQDAKIKTHHDVKAHKKVWVEYNDSHAVPHNNEKSVRNDIEKNGYLYFYDLVEIVDA